MSFVTPGCLLWLQHMQPVFFAIAAVALLYQLWLVRRTPPQSRTPGLKAMVLISCALNLVVLAGWLAMRLRYA